MSQLIPWETPFVDEFFPSVTFCVSMPLRGPDLLQLVVRGEYPRYVVTCHKLLHFSFFDEACAPPRVWPTPDTGDRKSCSWEWIDSPAIKSYESCNIDTATASPIPMFHYLIFGGDFNIEVIAKEKPIIQMVTEPSILTVEFPI